jgi:hypothetical protein
MHSLIIRLGIKKILFVNFTMKKGLAEWGQNSHGFEFISPELPDVQKADLFFSNSTWLEPEYKLSFFFFCGTGDWIIQDVMHATIGVHTQSPKFIHLK